MTQTDYERFCAAFDHLVRAFQKRFEGQSQEQRVEDRIETQLTYFRSLQRHPIDIIEAAALELSEGGSVDHWFPRAPEWGQLAADIELKRLLRAPKPKALPPAPEEKAEWMERSGEARQKFLEDCRKHGWEGSVAARLVEATPAVHPTDDPHGAWCLACSDTGVDSHTTAECGCIETNPVIRARRLKGHQSGVSMARRRRAAALNPSREKQLLSG